MTPVLFVGFGTCPWAATSTPSKQVARATKKTRMKPLLIKVGRLRILDVCGGQYERCRPPVASAIPAPLRALRGNVMIAPTKEIGRADTIETSGDHPAVLGRARASDGRGHDERQTRGRGAVQRAVEADRRAHAASDCGEEFCRSGHAGRAQWPHRALRDARADGPRPEEADARGSARPHT